MITWNITSPAVHRTENQTNMMHQKQQQQRDMVTPQNKSAGSKHEFVVRSFEVPTRCDHCSSVMIGLVRQGMVCKSKEFQCRLYYTYCILFFINVNMHINVHIA